MSKSASEKQTGTHTPTHTLLTMRCNIPAVLTHIRDGHTWFSAH